MKILVFGQTGQVARELQRRAPPGITLRTIGRAEADLGNPAACADVVSHATADVIVNAAAWTAVDLAETHEAAATVVNGAAPAAMAAAAAARGIPFVHISTDYVFDGSGTTAFAPDHPTGPLGAYGRSKLAGEAGVRAAGGVHVILRTSWVVSAHGANFVKTMLRLGAGRDRLRVVADQIGGPTPAADVADAIFGITRALQGGAAGGIHHLAGAPDVSWAGFAREIMAGAGLPCRIDEIASSDYPTPAARPLNSRLDCSSLDRDFGIARPDWRSGLAPILRDLGAGGSAN